MYVGRFAPSPTGALHFGSLVTALASYLDARAAGGRWLLRIEDIDPPRERPGSADSIRASLERLGLHWDGEVTRQSERGDHYRVALRQLYAQGALFACHCSRARIARDALRHTDEGPIYPGTCRAKPLPPLDYNDADAPVAWRLRVDGDNGPVRFEDGIQGLQHADPVTELGDFVLRRRDGLFAYQLAVAVDDHLQGITDVVRGVDLLTSTFRQLLVLRKLGANMPRYAHIPIAVDNVGHKLSKQDDARPIDAEPESLLLYRALVFLKQDPPRELRRTSAQAALSWAINHWNRTPLRGLTSLPCERAGN